MMPDRGPDPVGADQRQRQVLLPRHAAALEDGQSLGMGDHVFELPTQPQLDIGIVIDMGLQRPLQVGAMHDPIGRAGAKRGGLAKRQTNDFTAASRAHQADGVGRDSAMPKPRLQPELDQHATGIGRELQAGASFLEAFGFFEKDDAKAPARKREGGGQSSDPGTSDEDGA